MKRPWKVREIATGRVIRTYSTDAQAINKYLWMFALDIPILSDRAAELELVGPGGTVTRMAESMRTLQSIYDIGTWYLQAVR